MMIRNVLAALALTILVACTATPYDMPAPERAAMEQTVQQFSADFRNGRTASVVDIVPPKVTANLAKRAGIPVADLRRGVIQQTRAAMKLVKVVSYGMDTKQAQFFQTSTGRGYALIPTQTVIRAPGGQTIQSNNTTLAFADAGKWYLVRIDDASQRELLVDAYPEFSGLRVADGTTKVIG